MEETKETIVSKAYDLLKYSIPVLNRLPRNQKFVFADRIQNHLTDLLELLIAAYYAPANEKRPTLIKVNLLIEKLRYLFRLGFDLGYYNSTNFQQFAHRLLEIGRMNGAWLKSIKP